MSREKEEREAKLEEASDFLLGFIAASGVSGVAEELKAAAQKEAVVGRKDKHQKKNPRKKSSCCTIM